MRALPLITLALLASAATVHAQDRYSMRGVTVVRAPTAQPTPAGPAPGASYGPVNVQTAAPPPIAQNAARNAAQPMRYLSWPGKHDPQPLAARAEFAPQQPAPALQPARFVAPAPTPTRQAAPTPARDVAMPASLRSQPTSARGPSIYDAPPPAPAPARNRTTAAAQPPRPVSTHSLFRTFTDAAPAPERTASVGSPRATPSRTPARAAVQAAPAPVLASAPDRATAAASQQPAAAPALRQEASLTPRRAPVRWDQRPEFAAPAAAPAPVVQAPSPPSQPAAAAPRAAAKPSTKNVAIPVATRRAAAAPAAAASAGPVPAPVPVASVPPQRTPWLAANGGTQARFYSVHREFGVRPDAIEMPKQFFLDGSPDMARPPPLPIPRITPTSGQSTAVQRAAAERSQEDPDAPVN